MLALTKSETCSPLFLKYQIKGMAEKPVFVLPLEESDVTFSRLTKGRIRLLKRAFCRLYGGVYSPV